MTSPQATSPITVASIGNSIPTDDMLLLARAHFELWQRLGISSNPYHLQRARTLFQQFLDETNTNTDAETLMEFCKLLQHCGDMDAASRVIQVVISMSELDSNYANYLFYAGCIFKALQQHERANAYFFDAAQAGPPRFFNKLEMMVIISRTIEELQLLNGNNEDDTQETSVEENDAYAMVHAHMILEGHIDASLDVEDWIADAGTWLSLADKCAAHHMFSLATDFYGLGITRDAEAFRKPRLWYRFAKACSRCGRANDAVLAIRQALTRAPHLKQLMQAETAFAVLENSAMLLDGSINTTVEGLLLQSEENKEVHDIHDLAGSGTISIPFQQLISQRSLHGIVQLLPVLLPPELRAMRRIQAMVKGHLARRDWRRGVGRVLAAEQRHRQAYLEQMQQHNSSNDVKTEETRHLLSTTSSQDMTDGNNNYSNDNSLLIQHSPVQDMQTLQSLLARSHKPKRLQGRSALLFPPRLNRSEELVPAQTLLVALCIATNASWSGQVSSLSVSEALFPSISRNLSVTPAIAPLHRTGVPLPVTMALTTQFLSNRYLLLRIDYAEPSLYQNQTSSSHHKAHSMQTDENAAPSIVHYHRFLALQFPLLSSSDNSLEAAEKTDLAQNDRPATTDVRESVQQLALQYQSIEANPMKSPKQESTPVSVFNEDHSSSYKNAKRIVQEVKLLRHWSEAADPELLALLDTFDTNPSEATKFNRLALNVVYTNVESVSIYRAGFRWSCDGNGNQNAVEKCDSDARDLWLLRCTNTGSVTQLDLYQLHSARNILIVFAREHFSRALRIDLVVKRLLQRLVTHSTLASALLDGILPSSSSFSTSTSTSGKNSSAALYEVPYSSSKGKGVYEVSLRAVQDARGIALTIQQKESGLPVISDAFELFQLPEPHSGHATPAQKKKMVAGDITERRSRASTPATHPLSLPSRSANASSASLATAPWQSPKASKVKQVEDMMNMDEPTLSVVFFPSSKIDETRYFQEEVESTSTNVDVGNLDVPMDVSVDISVQQESTVEQKAPVEQEAKVFEEEKKHVPVLVPDPIPVSVPMAEPVAVSPVESTSKETADVVSKPSVVPLGIVPEEKLHIVTADIDTPSEAIEPIVLESAIAMMEADTVESESEASVASHATNASTGTSSTAKKRKSRISKKKSSKGLSSNGSMKRKGSVSEMVESLDDAKELTVTSSTEPLVAVVPAEEEVPTSDTVTLALMEEAPTSDTVTFALSEADAAEVSVTGESVSVMSSTSPQSKLDTIPSSPPLSPSLAIRSQLEGELEVYIDTILLDCVLDHDLIDTVISEGISIDTILAPALLSNFITESARHVVREAIVEVREELVWEKGCGYAQHMLMKVVIAEHVLRTAQRVLAASRIATKFIDTEIVPRCTEAVCMVEEDFDAPNIDYYDYDGDNAEGDIGGRGVLYHLNRKGCRPHEVFHSEALKMLKITGKYATVPMPEDEQDSDRGEQGFHFRRYSAQSLREKKQAQRHASLVRHLRHRHPRDTLIPNLHRHVRRQPQTSSLAIATDLLPSGMVPEGSGAYVNSSSSVASSLSTSQSSLFTIVTPLPNQYAFASAGELKRALHAHSPSLHTGTKPHSATTSSGHSGLFHELDLQSHCSQNSMQSSLGNLSSVSGLSALESFLILPDLHRQPSLHRKRAPIKKVLFSSTLNPVHHNHRSPYPSSSSSLASTHHLGPTAAQPGGSDDYDPIHPLHASSSHNSSAAPLLGTTGSTNSTLIMRTESLLDQRLDQYHHAAAAPAALPSAGDNPFAGSTTRALSSHSWQAGRFNVERPILQTQKTAEEEAEERAQRDKARELRAANSNNSIAGRLTDAQEQSVDLVAMLADVLYGNGKNSSGGGGGASMSDSLDGSKKTTNNNGNGHKPNSTWLQGSRKEFIAQYGEGPEDGLYIQSLKQVQRLGYVPTMEIGTEKLAKKRPWAYAAHWQRILAEFLAFHARPVPLKDVHDGLGDHVLDDWEDEDWLFDDATIGPSTDSSAGDPPQPQSMHISRLSPAAKHRLRPPPSSNHFGTSAIGSGGSSISSSNNNNKGKKRRLYSVPFYSLRKLMRTLHRALCATDVTVPLLQLPPDLAGAPPSNTPTKKPQQSVARFKTVERTSPPVTSVSSSATDSGLSVEELICALAETKGSVGAALVKLQDCDLEFLSEIRLVCGTVNVRALVCALPGGPSFFAHMQEALSNAHSSINDDAARHVLGLGSKLSTKNLSRFDATEAPSASVAGAHAASLMARKRPGQRTSSMVTTRSSQPDMIGVLAALSSVDSNYNGHDDGGNNTNTDHHHHHHHDSGNNVPFSRRRHEPVAEGDGDVSMHKKSVTDRAVMSKKASFYSDADDANAALAPPSSLAPGHLLESQSSLSFRSGRPQTLPSLKDHTNASTLPQLHLSVSSPVVMRHASVVNLHHTALTNSGSPESSEGDPSSRNHNHNNHNNNHHRANRGAASSSSSKSRTSLLRSFHAAAAAAASKDDDDGGSVSSVERDSAAAKARLPAVVPSADQVDALLGGDDIAVAVARTVKFAGMSRDEFDAQQELATSINHNYHNNTNTNDTIYQQHPSGHVVSSAHERTASGNHVSADGYAEATMKRTVQKPLHLMSTPSQTWSSPLPSPHIRKLAENAVKQRSFRVQSQVVERLYAETSATAAPVLVLCRRDALKAKQEETLLKSDKLYIREPIEQKLRRLSIRNSVCALQRNASKISAVDSVSSTESP